MKPGIVLSRDDRGSNLNIVGSPWVNVTPLHQGNLETGLTFLARNKRQLESSKSHDAEQRMKGGPPSKPDACLLWLVLNNEHNLGVDPNIRCMMMEDAITAHFQKR
jgi:hypothetical protein